MKIVITGSTGMIGLALINLLKNENIVYAITRPNSDKIKYIPQHSNVKIIECDLNNLSSLEDKIEQADIFFHLGWMGTYGNYRNDIYSQIDNIKITMDAVKLASLLGCKSFVGTGSQAEYGNHNETLTEDTSINPVTPYGIAKYTSGKLSRLYADELNIKHCWTRILSVYGPGDKKTLIGSCINAILNNQPFDTTNGDQVWDYIYSGDCAKALYEIAINGVNNQTYIICSGKKRRLKDYLIDLKDCINPDYELGFGKRDYNPNQVMYLTGDISKLEEDTNFRIETSFKEGIKKTVEWFKENN